MTGSRVLRAWLIAAICHVLFVPGQAVGEPEVEVPALSLNEAMRMALAANPELKAAELQIEIERMRGDADALSPPVTLETEIENFAGSGSSSGLDGAEVTLQLSRIFELGDKSALRREVGKLRVDQAMISEEAARLALAERVTQRFIDVIALQERTTLAQKTVGIAEQTLTIVQNRVDVGRSSEAELSTAVIALSRAELEHLDAERQLEKARMSLASLWGASAPRFAQAVGDFFDLPSVESFAALEQRLPDNPEIQRQAAELRLHAASRRLAESKRKADVSVSGGVRHLGEQDDVGLLFSVSVPFGSSSRARPEINEANLLLAQSPLRADAQRRELRALLFRLHQDLLFARTALVRLRETIIPHAENAVALYQEGFAVGSSTLLELADAQDRLLVLQGEALDAARDYHATLAEIEYLLGGRSGVPL
ncbi:MAG: TolC family protein [Woeseia sp.]